MMFLTFCKLSWALWGMAEYKDDGGGDQHYSPANRINNMKTIAIQVQTIGLTFFRFNYYNSWLLTTKTCG